MIPPLVRRCPDCGKIGLARSFAAVDGDDGYRTGSDGNRVECPRCGARFGSLDRPTLN